MRNQETDEEITRQAELDSFRIQIGKNIPKETKRGDKSSTRKSPQSTNEKPWTRRDLLWWKVMLPAIPERDILHDMTDISSYDLHLHTYANKTHGAALYGTAWYIIRFEPEEANEDISAREFSMIIRVIATCGNQWQGLRIIFHCDNMRVVIGAKSCYVKSHHLMRHFRTMQFLTTAIDFELRIIHILGKTNDLADLLSRDRLKLAQAKGYWIDSKETKLVPPPVHEFS